MTKKGISVAKCTEMCKNMKYKMQSMLQGKHISKVIGIGFVNESRIVILGLTIP